MYLYGTSKLGTTSDFDHQALFRVFHFRTARARGRLLSGTVSRGGLVWFELARGVFCVRRKGSFAKRAVCASGALLLGPSLARGGLSACELYQIRSSTYAHTPSALEPPSTHRLRAPQLRTLPLPPRRNLLFRTRCECFSCATIHPPTRTRTHTQTHTQMAKRKREQGSIEPDGFEPRTVRTHTHARAAHSLIRKSDPPHFSQMCKTKTSLHLPSPRPRLKKRKKAVRIKIPLKRILHREVKRAAGNMCAVSCECE